MDPFSLKTYQYHLPEELIAQRPAEPRDSSRLLVVDRQSGNISLTTFDQIQNYVEAGDQFVFNDTKVIPARLLGNKETGGKVEILLLKHLAEDAWEALVRPSKKLAVGTKVQFGKSFACTLTEKLAEGKARIRFQYTGNFASRLAEHGQIPLPHYIRREKEESLDSVCYQTVYASKPGAVAAPTAGLHFTRELLGELERKGVEQTRLTLHVGLGTFRPVQVEDIRMHAMHSEQVVIGEGTAEMLNKRCHKRIVVGTTTCRALESAADEEGNIIPGEFETDIFIYPGYEFKYVRALLTNFHLPCSTLLMLVSTFGGIELIREAYRIAVENKMRFYSYGDAMLIL